MSLSEKEMKVWTDLIDWLTVQEGFVIIGAKDGQVSARSSVELDEALEMVELVYEMLHHSLEGGAPGDLLTLQ